MALPNDWKECSLGDVTVRTDTWNPRTNPRDVVDYVDVSAVSREELRITAPSKYAGDAAPGRARKLVKSGDTIVATIRPTLRRIAQVPPALHDQLVSTAFCVLRADVTQVTADFLFFAVQHDSFTSGLASRQTGASYPAVRDADVLAQRIPIPPRPEQENIAAVLRDVRTAFLHERICELKAGKLRQAAMAAVFANGIRGARKKESEIGRVPEDWRVGNVRDMAEFQRGFDITKTEQVDGQVPVVSSGGIKSYHNVAAATGPGVVIGRKGSIGLLHYVDADYWPHDTTLWCRNFQGNIPRFVFYRLQTLDLQKLDSGATNPALNRNFLHAELVSWPEIDEQRDIVALLDAIDAKVKLHQKKATALNRLFRTLLHRFLNGELRVSELHLPSLDRNAAEVGA